MKPTQLIAMLSIAFSGAAYASEAHNHGKDHTPAHGGVVTEVNHSDYELVAKPDVLQLFLRAEGKSVDVSQGTAKLTILSGKEKQEVELKPASGKFEAKGEFKVAPGTKAVALVSLPGQPAVSVRFALK